MLQSIPVVSLDEVDSTNSEAMRRAAAGHPAPVWITTRRQTAGRGRSMRNWEMPEGNLAATLLICPQCPPGALPQLAFVAAVALYDTVCDTLTTAGLDPMAAGLRLKWPNDLLAGAAKLAGILVEATQHSGQAFVAVGFGVNLASAPAVLGRPTAALADLGAGEAPNIFLDLLSSAVLRNIVLWDDGRGFSATRAAWLQRATPIGTEITAHSERLSITGRFAGMGDDGALLLQRPDGTIERVTYGDVSLGPKA